MWCQNTYPRQALERASDHKKRKLSIEDEGEISLDRNLDTLIDSELEVVKDSQTSLKGHKDLFGELMPYNTAKGIEAKKKSIKKTPVTKKKKEPPKEVINNPIITPQIPTSKITKLIDEVHKELPTKIQTSDLPVLTTNNLDVSGIHSLQDSLSTSIRNESKTNANNNDDSLIKTNSQQILEGVVGFVDYKIGNDHSGSSIIQRLLELGAKVDKNLNRKITHVVFCEGYRCVYNKAIELGIPLVSAKWIECSALANKMLDPVDYLPDGLQKYKEPLKIKYLNAEESRKYLSPNYAVYNHLFKDTYDNLMEKYQNIKTVKTLTNTEYSPIIETPQETTVNQKDNSCKNGSLSTITDTLYKVLNKSDSPVPDDQIDELYVPISIKVFRKCLTPSGKKNTTPTELDSELAKIENRLNLNHQARKRFRQLLFPSDKNLNNISNITDFPSPSPQKLKILQDAPSRLTSNKKKKIVIDNKLLPNTNKLDNNKRTTPEKNTQSNLLKREIHSDLRTKQIRKLSVQKVKSVKKTQSHDTASNMTSSHSSKIILTPKASLASPIIVQSIACTGMTKIELNILKSSILNLGYIFHTTVEPMTTYLVTKPQPKQTLNILFAMAYGCFIVSEEWVHKSLKAGKWLSHEEYLISDLSEPIKELQMRRQTFGPSIAFHIFDKVGKIYISDTIEPPSNLLRRLVRACGGHCTNTETKADIVIGYTQQMNNNIHEKWILDSITQGTLLNKYQYMLTNTNK